MGFRSLFTSPKRSAGHSRKIANRFVPQLDILEDRTALSTLTVLSAADNGQGSLRDAIKDASSDDTIVFAPGLAGETITLTSHQLTITKSLNIQGPGASLLAISGNDTNRVFNISADLNVAISGLTITHGRSAEGGGILNVGSTLTLANDVLSYNKAVAGEANGGAISNQIGATLTVTGSKIIGNQAVGSGNGSNAFGGGIENPSGSTASLSGCTFAGNKAVGGDGGKVTNGSSFIGLGNGGGIHNFGSLTVVNSTFTANQAMAGNGGSGGNGASFYSIGIGLGGGITNGATLVLSGSSFAYNEAIGGSNATGSTSGHGILGNGQGGGLLINVGGVATVTNTTFIGNKALGGSRNTGGSWIIEVGVGQGGGIGLVGLVSPPTLNASNLTLTSNQAIGGAGNTGNGIAGAGVGGGLANIIAITTIVGSTFTANQAFGGYGADGLGGGIANLFGSTLAVSDCTLTANQATGGAGAIGGNGLGGGIWNDVQCTLTVTGSTITENQATGGAAGVGQGGGLYLTSGGTACLDAFTRDHAKHNHASTSDDDIFGIFSICS
jgi:hypothetical protein